MSEKLMFCEFYGSVNNMHGEILSKHIGGCTLGDAWCMPPTPTQVSRFFRFDIQNFQNVNDSVVNASPMRSMPPPTGNPGSATGTLMDALT